MAAKRKGMHTLIHLFSLPVTGQQRLNCNDLQVLVRNIWSLITEVKSSPVMESSAEIQFDNLIFFPNNTSHSNSQNTSKKVMSITTMHESSSQILES